MTSPKLFPLGAHIPNVRNSDGTRTSRHQQTCQRHNTAAKPLAKLNESLPWVAPKKEQA
tara:strand:- start:408 stop:584 length:177 start_codon:yes stop_codon:yes gene_type:complete